MGWKISEQTVRFLLCNEGSDDDTESIRNTLEPFNLFVFVLHIPSIHLDFDRKLNGTLDGLDLVSADRLLFFAFVEPDNSGANRPETRPYYRDLQSWENKIFPNGSISCEIEQIVREIARSLDIPFDSLPAMVVSNNILAKKKRWYKTSTETIDEQLYQLGLIARNYPEIKTNWKYAGHILESHKQRIDLCNASGSKLVSTDDLEEVLSNLLLRNAQSEIRSDRVAKKDASVEPQYAFYSEGPTWTITFDGKTIRGLRGKGFEYLHHLVSNKFNDIYPSEFMQLSSAPENDFRDPNKQINLPIDFEDGAEKRDVDFDEIFARDFPIETLDDQFLEEIKKERTRLHKEVKEAAGNNDLDRKEKAIKDLERFKWHIAEYLGKKGKIKIFKDGTKKTKDRIAVNINRALNRIQKENKAAYKHFKWALGSLYTEQLSYRPSEDIDWHTYK